MINCSDLKEQLLNELEQLKHCDPRLFDKTVTEAIQSLMESVNQRYYHVSGPPLRFCGGLKIKMGLAGTTGGLDGNDNKKNNQAPTSHPKPDPNYSPARLLEKYECLKKVTLTNIPKL